MVLCLVGQKRGLEREKPHLEMGCVGFGKEIAGKTAPCGGRERGERGWGAHLEGVCQDRGGSGWGWLSPGLLCAYKSR